MVVIVEDKHDGYTVLDFVKKELGMSRRLLIRLKQTGGGISVNGLNVTVRAVLHAGDVLSLMVEDEWESHLSALAKGGMSPAAEGDSIEIIYEDKYLLAVNKPSNMPTHPSFSHFDDTLANVLSGKIATFRPINRLDLDTSGLILIAKDQLTAYKMSQKLIKGGVKKRYIAVLAGIIEPEDGIIETYIKRKPDSIIEREVSKTGTESEYAKTEYHCIGKNDKMSVVYAYPITGRTHQLRVHFAYKNCPVYGDTLYGTACDEINRQALHSEMLEFNHPETGERLKLTASVAKDIKVLYEAWLNEENI